MAVFEPFDVLVKDMLRLGSVKKHAPCCTRCFWNDAARLPKMSSDRASLGTKGAHADANASKAEEHRQP